MSAGVGLYARAAACASYLALESVEISAELRFAKRATTVAHKDKIPFALNNGAIVWLEERSSGMCGVEDGIDFK